MQESMDALRMRAPVANSELPQAFRPLPAISNGAEVCFSLRALHQFSVPWCACESLLAIAGILVLHALFLMCGQRAV